MEFRRWRWVAGMALLVPVLLWVGSIAALMEGLKANEAAGVLSREHGRWAARGRVEHLHGLAVMWSVALSGLQIAAGLVGAGALRVVYRLRAAVCFAVSGGVVILLNMAWLFGLLVWLRASGEMR